MYSIKNNYGVPIETNAEKVKTCTYFDRSIILHASCRKYTYV